MADANVIAAVNILTSNQADATAIIQETDEVVYELGRQPVLTNIYSLAAVAGIREYTFADTDIELFNILYYNRQLGEMRLREIEWLNRDWRDIPGQPVAYVLEDEARKSFSVYPTPIQPGGAGAVNNFQIFVTEYRGTVPLYMDWPLALLVVAKEYRRDSTHRDLDYAVAAQMVGQLLFKFIV